MIKQRLSALRFVLPVLILMCLALGLLAGSAKGIEPGDEGSAAAQPTGAEAAELDDSDSAEDDLDEPGDETPTDTQPVDTQPVEEAEEQTDELSPEFGLPGRRTEHYFIYSQLSEEATTDLSHRLESMYDYYSKRFKDVYSPINFPKQVFLFSNRQDFVAAGGHPTMPGVFMGGGDSVGARLMLIFREGNLGSFMMSCPLMYHEAFHQFVAIDISQAGNVNRKWPVWLDESYATVFNNITWTGDGWVDGIARNEMVASAVDNKSSFIPLRRLMDITGAKWHELTSKGKIWPIYMEGWSLIFFLNHASRGKYRPLLATYVEQVSTGQDSSVTRRRIISLQGTFSRWVRRDLHLHMTGAKYFEIFTAMATSHLARAHARGQRFESGEDFLAMAKNRMLNLPPLGDDQWLPDTLRQELLWYHNLLTQSHQPFKFTIEYPSGGGLPVIHVAQPRFGLVMKGTYRLDDDGKVKRVKVDYVRCPSIDLVKAKKAVGTR
ncbi:hypothetical protein LCGC14_0161860 [marine sediment metagenome]|uniref:DUF1570 domain-containing protein n=1 Tax=marine sediment metagenome TaxID=412755 RepID=A0A0F9XD48_9ZZZZ|nr:hypothetical protein [Phycisphaerae bacterium]HDZ45051.1 hypothetical protein [Phycisphaerae bacterium]